MPELLTRARGEVSGNPVEERGLAFEEQEATLGKDPWSYGLTPQNRKNLETVQRYAHQQGLIKTIVPLDTLFADTDLGDSAGNEEV